VLAGIDGAATVGFSRIKLNTVVMRGRNADEVLRPVDYPDADEPILRATQSGLLRKPMCHEFSSVGEVQVLRFLKRYG
jgi:molybdenum cofactor biosynthesis enzyme MoaA